LQNLARRKCRNWHRNLPREFVCTSFRAAGHCSMFCIACCILRTNWHRTFCLSVRYIFLDCVCSPFSFCLFVCLSVCVILCTSCLRARSCDSREVDLVHKLSMRNFVKCMKAKCTKEAI
jgi:hypothetical protein